MTEILKPCATCLHYISHTGKFLSFDYCDNPEYIIESKNYVTGEITYFRPHCYDLRETKGKCGPDGNGWEEAPPPEPKEPRSFKGTLKAFLLDFL